MSPDRNCDAECMTQNEAMTGKKSSSLTAFFKGLASLLPRVTMTLRFGLTLARQVHLQNDVALAFWGSDFVRCLLFKLPGFQSKLQH